jgi:hypothetical protein
MCSLVVEYFKFKIVTNLELELTANEYVAFPAVTFKVINWLNFNNYKHSIGIISDLNETIKTLSGDLKEDFIVARNNFMASYQQYESLLQYDHQLETEVVLNSIYSCRFNSQPCDVNDFIITKVDVDGAYLHFNAGKTLNGSHIPVKMTKYGRKSGLELELFIDLPLNESPLAKERGVTLYIHKINETIMREDHGIFLSTNTHHNIGIDKKITKRLPEPFNFCAENFVKPTNILNSYFYDMTINLTDSYSQKYCFDLCYQNAIIKNCDCYDEKLIKYINYNESLLSCSQKYYENIHLNTSKKTELNYLDYQDFLISCPNLVKDAYYAGNYVEKCLPYCPTECEYENYDTQISKSAYPSFHYAQVLAKNRIIKEKFKDLNRELNIDDLKGSLLSVSVYFNSDSVTKISEVPFKTLTDLISEFGENLGMFLGLSILSTFEIIDLMFKLATVYLAKLTMEFNMKIKQVFNLFFNNLFY